MKTISKIAGVLLINVMFINSAAYADLGNWKAVSTAIVEKEYAKALPLKFRAIELDFQSIKNELSVAAKANYFFQAKQKGIILSLPLPNGGFEDFSIIETPMMEPALAEKYPEIKTYSGVSLSNPQSTVKIDYGYMGFHALVFSTEGRYFISPLNNSSNKNYLVFYENDLPASTQPLLCGTNPTAAEAEESRLRMEDYNRSKSSAVEITYRAYRMAVSCTVEYAQAATGFASPTKAQVLSKVVTTINNVNGLYERENAVHFNLIANTDVLFYLTGNDPFTNESGAAMLGENQTLINNTIGSANYDVGHAFSTGPGGVAALAAICVNSRKATGVTGLPTPVGVQFDIDFLSHELGHMFGANHTFNSITGGCAGNRSDGTAYEPGGGSTIMAYYTQCGADVITTVGDRVFHASALDEMYAFFTKGAGNSCPVKTPTGNFQPTLNAGPDYIIPLNTPFMLTGQALDPDGDSLVFNWVEMDLGPAGAPNSPVGNAPTFRSFPPAISKTRLFPRLSNIIANTQTKGEKMASYPRSMRMRFLARDNKPMAGAFGFDEMDIAVVANAGPFSISTSNVIDTFFVGTTQTVKWNVANTTSLPVNCQKVRITFSVDNGNTFSKVLLDSTENDGSAEFIVPAVATALGRIRVEAVGNIFFDINNSAITVLTASIPNYSLFSAAIKTNTCAPDSTVIMVTAQRLLSFNSPITLSVSGLPAGAVASAFSKDPILPNDTSYIKISSLGLTAGNKSIKINAKGDTIVHDYIAFYSILAPIILQPTLSSPISGQTNVLPKLTFSWLTVANASFYRLQVAMDTTFNNIILDTISIGNLANTFYVLSLPQYKKLFWRVAANNDCGFGPNSVISSFTTNGVPPFPTNLKKLSNTGTSLTIRWEDNANNENSYKIERSENTNGAYVQVASLAADAKQYVSNNLVLGTLYYFKVRCLNLVGYSEYSNEIAVGLNVGTNNQETLTVFSVFPNPAYDKFTLSFSNELLGDLDIQLYDDLGRMVWQENSIKKEETFFKEIPMDKLPKGIYFIKIKTEENVWTNKILKL